MEEGEAERLGDSVALDVWVSLGEADALGLDDELDVVDSLEDNVKLGLTVELAVTDRLGVAVALVDPEPLSEPVALRETDSLAV